MQPSKKWAAISIAAAIGVAIVAASATVLLIDVEANENNPDASRIVETISQASESHDAAGHSLHEVVYFVHPKEGQIYSGTVTFAASREVDIFVYHDVTENKDQIGGFNVHEVHGRLYAVTPGLKNATTGIVEFVGAGILAHVHVDPGNPPGDFNIVASIDAANRNAAARE